MIAGFGDPEVGQLDLAGIAQKHVRPLHVAKNDAGRVSVVVRRVRDVPVMQERQ